MDSSGKLDDIDTKLLALLQENGRATSTSLAKEVGLSVPSVLDRIRKLEDKGVITRFTAIVDPVKLGMNLVAFVLVSLVFHRKGSIESFKHAVKRFTEVMECYHVSGEGDFLLKVMVEDIDAYREFLVSKLTVLDVVDRVTTMIVFDTLKNETRLSLAHGEIMPIEER